jgi:asparagine synthetase B (glutamine-hydrolysing)
MFSQQGSLPAPRHASCVDPLLQLAMCPYTGAADLTPLTGETGMRRTIDLISLADLLRNAFVYPPHSIYQNVKVATSGFDTAREMLCDAAFVAPHAAPTSRAAPVANRTSPDWTMDYHRRLCDAIQRTCAPMQRPWFLQSGGKDSTSLAIALSEVRPDAVCLTYQGGDEENELESAHAVARKLGLRHERLICDPVRAYDRYLALISNVPLPTADFALLSYADLATEIARHDGDGIVDGLGSDVYFGTPCHRQLRLLTFLARRWPLPSSLHDARWIQRSFWLSYLMATAQMTAFERFFPGSRFRDAEVDALLGRRVAASSRERMKRFEPAIQAAENADERRRIAVYLAEGAAAFAKGIYTASALAIRIGFPFCDQALANWVCDEVPAALKRDRRTGQSKILVRNHIERHFSALPYVSRKGSFRFDLRGLATKRFDQVFAYAEQTRDWLPGATDWLTRHRRHLDNKFHASKFYLLAVTLPWLATHGHIPRSDDL